MKYFRWLALCVLATVAYADEPASDGHSVIYMGENSITVLRLQIQVAGKTPQQSFEQYVDDLMKSLDANKDGVVTMDEARGKYLTNRDAMQAQLVPQSTTQTPELSPDVSPADEKITRAEFLTYFRRIGLQPFVVLYQPSAPAAIVNRPGRNAAPSPQVPLFARLDTNGDGKLSAEELTGALQTLRKLDLDDDETVSAAELNPIGNNNFAQQPQMTNPQTPTVSPFLGVGSDESLQKQVRRLVNKYDSFDPSKSGVADSKLRNQKLSPQELGLSQDAFARFDGDGDGQLDFDELRQLLSSPDPTITIRVNIDTGEPLRGESTVSEIQEKLKITPDGTANVNLGTTQLSIARGASYDMGDAEMFIKPLFMFADSDANGYLEKSETERMFLYGATFENLDSDKNGKIFFDEATAYFKTRIEAARSRVVLSITEQGRTLFEILDTDRDRRLSFRELHVAADKLALWDKDGDGLLSESEIPLQYRLTIARGSLPAINGNFANPQMNQTGTPQERTSGPLWFRKMDKNRDGEVSEREFLGDQAAFEKLDRNHDGFIDMAEAAQAGAE